MLNSRVADERFTESSQRLEGKILVAYDPCRNHHQEAELGTEPRTSLLSVPKLLLRDSFDALISNTLKLFQMLTKKKKDFVDHHLSSNIFIDSDLSSFTDLDLQRFSLAFTFCLQHFFQIEKKIVLLGFVG